MNIGIIYAHLRKEKIKILKQVFFHHDSEYFALVSKLTRTKLTSGKKIFLKVQRRKVKDKLITNQDSNLLVSY